MSSEPKNHLRAALLILLPGSLAVVVVLLAGAPDLVGAVLLVVALTAANLLVLAGLARREKRAAETVDDAPAPRAEPVEHAPRREAHVTASRRTTAQSAEVDRKQASIEKFAALGRLSAGVAHEINNPVGGILTCLESLRGLEPGSDRYDEYLRLVKSGVARIGKIVRQLLSFSRQPTGERQAVDTNAIIREVTVLSAFHDRHNEVEVIREEGNLPAVHGFPDLLNQLFLNLVMNALQAMPEGGKLRIHTQARNGEVIATFEDTGPGLPPENMERIFEPFFTTKGVGVGTGLGLSVALGIVEAHGGSIEAENTAAGGARFTVRLPIATQNDPGREGSEDHP